MEYACLTFDQTAFPGLANVRAWLTSQTGERAKALGDLAVRGKFSIANSHGRRAWFVYRFADVAAGKVPRLSGLKSGAELEGGVTAYGY